MELQLPACWLCFRGVAPGQTWMCYSCLASVHAAVIAINEAIDQGVPEGTLAAMQNPNAMLVQLDPSSASQYHDTLYRAKGEKVASSRKRVRGPDFKV